MKIHRMYKIYFSATGTTEKIDVFIAILIVHHCAFSLAKHSGKVTAIGTHGGFVFFKCRTVHT